MLLQYFTRFTNLRWRKILSQKTIIVVWTESLGQNMGIAQRNFLYYFLGPFCHDIYNFIILYKFKWKRNSLVLIHTEWSDLKGLLLQSYSLNPNHQESNLQIKCKQSIFLELGGKHSLFSQEATASLFSRLPYYCDIILRPKSASG